MNTLQILHDNPQAGIKEVYHTAYYTIANQLIEQGNSESQAREYFRLAVVFLTKQVKENDFDPDMDVTLYLSTVIQGLKESAG